MRRSPTALSTEKLKAEGFLVDVCERWIPGANIRKDLFGIADLVAIHPRLGSVVLVQVTSQSNVSARKKKIEASPFIFDLLSVSNIAVQVHGWSKDCKTCSVASIHKWGEKLELV